MKIHQNEPPLQLNAENSCQRIKNKQQLQSRKISLEKFIKSQPNGL